MSASCGSCGQRIMWLPSTKPGGGMVPLDLPPLPVGQGLDGELVVMRVRVDGVVKAWTMRGADLAPDNVVDQCRYRNHFQTCPNADQHRKPKKHAAPGQAELF